MFPIGRHHKAHCECHNQLIGNQVWSTCYLTKWSSRLAASVMRFDAVRLFAVRLLQIYANKPTTFDELRTNIEREIAAVSADLCLKIVKNWVQRLKRACGGHAKEIELDS